MRKIPLVILLWAIGISAAAQKLSKSIILKDTTFNNTITFVVGKNVNRVECDLNGFLSRGNFAINVEDPEGRKHLGFELGVEVNTGKPTQSAKGAVTRTLKFPLAGTWKMKIETTAATGHFTYDIHIR